jgi:hypothetical protein
VTAREAALARIRRQGVRIREIASPDGREVARCPTCHGAIDDAPGAHPALAGQEVFRDVPCTACHRGRGRALTVREAHLGLLAAGEFDAGAYSLRGRIERLAGQDPAAAARARDELSQLTGEEPGAAGEAAAAGAASDSALAARWLDWWSHASAYFEPGEREGEGGSSALSAAGVDPWAWSSRGRPLQYVGSRKCLSCHEVLHREHSRRWMPTKFRSLERLVNERNPERCFPCHTTGYDPATHRYAEAGVTCEGCHGPGERYDEMMVVGQEMVSAGDVARGRALLDAASRLAREAIDRRLMPGDRGPVNVCVSCHQPWEHRDGGPSTLERAPVTAAASPRRVAKGTR